MLSLFGNRALGINKLVALIERNEQLVATVVTDKSVYVYYKLAAFVICCRGNDRSRNARPISTLTCRCAVLGVDNLDVIEVVTARKVAYVVDTFGGNVELGYIGGVLYCGRGVLNKNTAVLVEDCGISICIATCPPKFYDSRTLGFNLNCVENLIAELGLRTPSKSSGATVAVRKVLISKVPLP